MYKFLLPTLLLLTGCATSYQPDSFTGGFSEVQLDKNVWKVSFVGNGFTRSERAEELAMLRSAELTLKNGYSFFAFVSSSTRNTTHAIPQASTSTTTFNATSIGGSTFGTAQTNTIGGGMMYVNKPSSDNTVMMFSTRPNISAMVYDASFICNSIGKKYEVVCNAKK